MITDSMNVFKVIIEQAYRDEYADQIKQKEN